MIRNREPMPVGRSLYQHFPLETWLGAAAMYSGLSRFLPIPTASTSRAVALALPRLVDVWSVLYAIGGLLLMVGLGRRSPRIEGAGLCLLIGGLAVSAGAIIQAGAPVVPSLVLQGGLTLACLVRLRSLWTL